MSAGITGGAGAAVAASFLAGAEVVPEQDTQTTAVTQAAAKSAFLFIRTTR